MSHYSQSSRRDAYRPETIKHEPEGSLWVGNPPSPQPMNECLSNHRDADLEETTQHEPEGSLWVSNPPSPESTSEYGGSIDGDESLFPQESPPRLPLFWSSPSPVFKRLPPFRSSPAFQSSPALGRLPVFKLLPSFEQCAAETEPEKTGRLSPAICDRRPIQVFAATAPLLGLLYYDADDQHSAADHSVEDTDEGLPTAAASATPDPPPAAGPDGEGEEVDDTGVELINALHQSAKSLPPGLMGCSYTRLDYSPKLVDEASAALPQVVTAAAAAATKDAWTQTVAEESVGRVEDAALFAQQRIGEDEAVWKYAAAVLSFVAVFWMMLEFALGG